MSRFRIRATTFALLTALSLMLVPSFAFAGVSEYQIQYAPVGLSGNMDLIVNVVLTPDTKLPATVRVPLPAGATVLWAGEILGGDSKNDPSREVTLTPSGAGQYAEFTLEQVRVAQVEAELGAAQVSGNVVSSKLDWVNSTDAGTYTFSVRLEPSIADLKITPEPEGTPQSNADGESLYTLTPVRIENGASFPITVTYRRIAVGSAGAAGNISPALIVALVALAIAVGALVVVLVRQRSSATPPSPATPGQSRTSGAKGTSPTASAPSTSAPSEDEDETFTWD